MYMKVHKMMTMIALSVLFVACNQAKQENENKEGEEKATTTEEKAPVTLTLKWETEPLLTTCESVLHDQDEDVLYVSNINGAPDGKDGNGFISKVSLDGKVTEQNWAKGMNAPKGMGLHDGKLYVADIDKVHEVDTKTGKITKSHPVKGATFLNDIAVDNGKVYVSDSRGGSIYLIEDGKVSTFMSDLQGPNGLFTDNNEIVMALWNEKSLNTVDPSTKAVTRRAEGIENPDGIEAIGNNEYLVSSWNGMVHHVDSDWKATLVLDTRTDSVNSADIEYVRSKNLLLVPTFFKNTVRAYEVSK
jgi:outer membrane protein assembly factor BamB